MNTQSIVQLVQRSFFFSPPIWSDAYCVVVVVAVISLNYVIVVIVDTSEFFFLFRYRSGIRGYMKSVVLDLLKRYLQVEMQFQQGNISTPSGFMSPLLYCNCSSVMMEMLLFIFGP